MSKWSTRWMDEKGRLFGRINVIDFAVILFLLFILPMFYFGYKIYSRMDGDVLEASGEKVYYDTTVDCLMMGVEPETAKKVAVGDVERDETGKVIGRIINLYVPTPYMKSFAMDSSNTLLLADQHLKQIPVQFQLTVYTQNDRIYYKDKTNLIVNHSPIKFKTDQYETTCRVKTSVDMRNLVQASLRQEEYEKLKELEKHARLKELEKHARLKELEKHARLKEPEKHEKLKNPEKPFVPFEKWATIRASFVDIPESLDAVKAGDEHKENNGYVMAKILHIVSKNPFEILSLKDDQFVKIKHPYKRELVADLGVRCLKQYEKLGDCYYQNEPLRIDSPVVFVSSTYLIKGKILQIKNIE